MELISDRIMPDLSLLLFTEWLKLKSENRNQAYSVRALRIKRSFLVIKLSVVEKEN